MDSRPYLYVLVRVRKSGSQSLVKMMTSALLQQKLYAMPPVAPLSDLGVGLMEDFRRIRRTRKRLWKLFRCLNWEDSWQHIDTHAKSGDIVSGHMMYGVSKLPGWDLRYITLMRDPVDRLYSEYRYCRQSYYQRPLWRRTYLSARLKVAGKGEFSNYVSYLHSMKQQFANPLVGYITGEVDISSPYEFLREHYFHYGTLERLEGFAEGLSAKLGLPVGTVWKNQTRGQADVSSVSYDEAQLNELIGRDLELYRLVSAEYA